jgi:hypothetical protein
MSSRVDIKFDAYVPEMGAHKKLNLQYPASSEGGKQKAKGNGASIHRVVVRSRLDFERVKELLATLEQPDSRSFNIAQVCVLVRPDGSAAAMLLRCAAAVQPGVIFQWFRDELQLNNEQTDQHIELSKISRILKGGNNLGKTEWYPVCLQFMKEQAKDTQHYYNGDYVSGEHAFFEWSCPARRFTCRYYFALIACYHR